MKQSSIVYTWQSQTPDARVIALDKCVVMGIVYGSK
jgi:hypothetical protein